MEPGWKSDAGKRWGSRRRSRGRWSLVSGIIIVLLGWLLLYAVLRHEHGDWNSEKESRPQFASAFIVLPPPLLIMDTMPDYGKRNEPQEDTPDNKGPGLARPSTDIAPPSPKRGPQNSASVADTILRRSPREPPASTLWDAVDDYVCSRTCDKSYDVVVVGGGVSGVYAAWRLQQSNPSMTVAVLEATKRTGGRLFSVPIPGMPDLSADVGGMHYLSKPNEMLNAWLVETVFNMSTRAFPQNVSDPRSSAFIRNTRLAADQLGNIDVVGKLYRFDDTDKTLFASDFLTIYKNVYLKAVAGFNDTDFDAWSGMTVDGRKLYDVTQRGLQDLAGVSSELLQYTSDANGYNTAGQIRQASAATVDMFKNVLIGLYADYRAPRGGMEALPARLVSEFERMGGTVLVNSPVKALSKCGSAGSQRQAMLVVGAEGKVQTFCAKKTVLALPVNALDALWWRPLALDGSWQGVYADTASKLFLGFDRPWWREQPFGFYEGVEVSSLDIHHTYFIGTQDDYSARNSSHGNRNSLVLASYVNGPPGYRWEELEAEVANLAAFRGLPNPFAEGDVIPNATDFTVSQKMVDLAMAQLCKLHGVPSDAIPKPYTAVAKHWPASWHSWHVGFNPNDVIRNVSQLDAQQDVFVCGEAYSKSQGWAEGGLRSTEHVLEKFFSLKPPPGMPTKWMKRYEGT